MKKVKSKNVQTTKANSNDISWFTKMEQAHRKAAELLKNVLLSNGYLSFEIAFSDIEKSYGMFKEFLQNQNVEFSNTIKTSKKSMESALEIALKNIEARFKIPKQRC